MCYGLFIPSFLHHDIQLWDIQLHSIKIYFILITIGKENRDFCSNAG